VAGISIGYGDKPHAVSLSGPLRSRPACPAIAIIGMGAKGDDVQFLPLAGQRQGCHHANHKEGTSTGKNSDHKKSPITDDFPPAIAGAGKYKIDNDSDARVNVNHNESA
jgi:hypothetical protein